MTENNGWILWQLFSAIHAIAYIRCNKDDATHKKYYWTTQFNFQALWFVLWLGGLVAQCSLTAFQLSDNHLMSLANTKKKFQHNVCGGYYTAITYDVIHDVVILFTSA